MAKALSFTAACVFCLLSFVLNFEHVLTSDRRWSQHRADYDDYDKPRDYERELQSMVKHVEPLMAILRNRQRDIESTVDRVNGGINNSGMRNYDQHPVFPNNFLNRLDQLASPTLGTQSVLPFNRLGPGMSPSGGLANALAMLNSNTIKRYGGGGYGGSSYGGGLNGGYGGGSSYGAGSLCCGQNSQMGQFSTLGLVSIIATALLYLLFFYYISTSTTTTTATGRRRRRAYRDEADQDLDDEFDFLNQQDIVMLDGPTWLSMVHELWEQDDSPENMACIQETLCRMNRLAMAAPGQAGWAVSLSSLPLSYLLHARHTGGFTSYVDAALMGRSGANCTELYSSCPRLQY